MYTKRGRGEPPFGADGRLTSESKKSFARRGGLLDRLEGEGWRMLLLNMF